ncbi:TetR/AcrR family transcriptional regulator [Amnibacterium sp.]|uniref:TetR/AcrR family transcriptional regulator n=1 Tax=Amnibacterium sp. TaxID=1872496 RepID=UPI00260B50E4|nr:TetR/AcrR family transcriptional regulator [Amnibacterium sp.]MCU1472902.1 acrR 1 [Amnibacterium sp.]
MSRRVEQVDETRQRIVGAAVTLHGTVGPARTTIAAIAEVAGVTRVTVYRHFPDEEALYGACSAHWLSRQQVPDPSAWADIEQPLERLRFGLLDLYRFYRDGSGMLTGIYRDWDALPAGQRQGLGEQNLSFRRALREPFVAASAPGVLDAVIGHAVSFWTWHSLNLDNGLSNEEAVTLMVELAASVTARDSSGVEPAGRTRADGRGARPEGLELPTF